MSNQQASFQPSLAVSTVFEQIKPLQEELALIAITVERRHKIIQEFCNDHEVIERLQVTPQELQALSGASLLGPLICKEDVLFMLRQIREVRNLGELQATVRPEPLYVGDENIGPSMPDFSEMAERIRREALPKLDESDALRDIYRQSMLGQLGVFCSALGLMPVMVWRRIRSLY